MDSIQTAINSEGSGLFDKLRKNQLINGMSFDNELGSYVIEIRDIIFESEEKQDNHYIDNLNKIAGNYHNAVNSIIEFMLPDFKSVYDKLDRESVRERLGKPIIDYDNGTVKYLEQSFDDFHILEFELLDDEFRDITFQ